MLKVSEILVCVLILSFIAIPALGQTQPYTIEPNTNAVWTKVNLTANQPLTIFVNNTSGYTSNGDNVFIFNDNFSSVNLSKWSQYINNSATATTSGNILTMNSVVGATNWQYMRSINTFDPSNKIIEFYAKENLTDYVANIGLSTANSSSAMASNYLGIQIQNNSSYSVVPKLYSSAGNVNLGSGALPNVWYKYTIKYTPGNISVYLNDQPALMSQAQTITSASTYAFHIGEVGAYNAGNQLQVGWVRLRNYTPVEPTVAMAGHRVINGVNYTLVNITSPATLSNYAVNLSNVVNASGTSDSIDIETGLNPPVASFTSNTTNPGVYGTVQFTDTSTNNPTSGCCDYILIHLRAARRQRVGYNISIDRIHRSRHNPGGVDI